MEDKINSMVFEDEFRACPICGYTDGFHSMFRQDKGRVKWLFICPACHEIFDIGFLAENAKENR